MVTKISKDIDLTIAKQTQKKYLQQLKVIVKESSYNYSKSIIRGISYNLMKNYQR